MRILSCPLTRGKGEILKVLAALSRETNFTQAAKAPETALGYAAGDTDSILATFNRLNRQVPELDPLVLPPSTPQMPPVRPQVDQKERDHCHQFGVQQVGEYFLRRADDGGHDWLAGAPQLPTAIRRSKLPD